MNKFLGFLLLTFTTASLAGTSFITKTQEEKNAAKHYAIKITYPELPASKSDKTSQEFNHDMTLAVKNLLDAFKAKINSAANSLPNKQNTFQLSYTATMLRFREQKIAVVRLNEEIFFAGAAHPEHHLKTINFDMRDSEILSWDDLFQVKSDYLKIIATNATALLQKQKVDVITPDGLLPTEKNYQHWLLEPNGLRIIFDEVQVAPYVSGQPEVLIPYKVFASILANYSPITICIQDANDCRRD